MEVVLVPLAPSGPDGGRGTSNTPPWLTLFPEQGNGNKVDRSSWRTPSCDRGTGLSGVQRMEKATVMSTQTYLPGTEPAHHNADIEKALDAWFEARSSQRSAADATKIRHEALLLHMGHAGVESYPYVDPMTGKKRLVKVDRTPKAKTATAPKWSKRDADAATPEEAEEKRKERKAKKQADKVEVRRVPRKSVEKELDPFAATRAAMEKGQAERDVADKGAKHAKPKATRKR